MNIITARVVYNKQCTIKCSTNKSNMKCCEEYNLYKYKRQQIKEKVKLMQKLIKEANFKYKEEYPFEYRKAWRTIFNCSNDLRKEIDNFNQMYDIEDINVASQEDIEVCLTDN